MTDLTKHVSGNTKAIVVVIDLSSAPGLYLAETLSNINPSMEKSLDLSKMMSCKFIVSCVDIEKNEFTCVPCLNKKLMIEGVDHMFKEARKISKTVTILTMPDTISGDVFAQIVITRAQGHE